MEQVKFLAIYFIFMVLILGVAGFVGYKHLEYIDIMRHSPCDLCLKCPHNIFVNNTKDFTIPEEYLMGFLDNGTEIYT